MSEYITTYTGLHFRPTEPDSDLIRIQDIAHALSLICRGNGHVQTFWSVGEHCICCAKEAAARGFSERMILACLLHDAIVLIMAGENDILSQTTVLIGTVHIMAQDRLSLSTACLLKAKP